MIKSCPDSVDVTDLQFKLQCRLKVFENGDASTFSNTNSLLTCASRYGILFVGTNSNQFQVIQTQKLQAYTSKDKDVTDYPRRNIDVPSSPKHLCVNCDNTILAVVVEKDQCAVVLFYEVLSFLTQNINVIKEVRLSSTPNVYVREINWNPSLPAIFTACKSDGTLGVYELKGESVDINELPAASGANCFCWSPKGKQIAVGSKDGKITQYKPDLKAVKVINEPKLENPHALISLQWVSNYQFIGVYQSLQPEGASCVIVVDAPKTGEPGYTNYEDICYSGSSRQPQFYLILQQNWNFLMVASANSSEVGVLGNNGDVWTQWIMSDTGRAELPLSSDHQETLPVGLTLDISSTTVLPWGESSIPPCPLLCLLSNQGVLCCFNVVYLKEGIPSVCTPADPVQDLSGLSSFVTTSGKNVVTTVVQPKIPQSSFAPPSFGMASNLPQTANPPIFKDASTPATKVTASFAPASQNIPPVSVNVTSDTAPKNLFGNQATLTPIKPQQSGQATSLFGGQTLITPISKNPNVNLPNTTTGQAVKFDSGKYASIFSALNPTSLPQASTVPVKPIVISAAKSEATIKQQEPSAAKGLEITAPKPALLPASKQEIKAVDPKLKAETSAMLSQMIRDEWMYLEAELKVLLNQGRNIKIALGTDEEKLDMITQIESLQEFVKEAVDISVGQSSEIHGLKQNLIQSWAWFEEANSYYNSSKNEAVALLLKLQPLDSVSQKRLKDIEQLSYYIESQLHQTSKSLDEQWGNFQDYAKKTHRIQMPTMETIFQTMVRQNAILQKQTYILKDISMRLKKKTFGVSSLLLSLDQAENLADDLKELRLDPQDILQLQYEKIKNYTKIISNKKANMLRSLLKKRDITNITAVKPQLSSWTINQSSASKMSQSISILGAQMSPVSKTPVARNLDFVQSTPVKVSEASKSTQIGKETTFSLKGTEKPTFVISSSTPAPSGFVSLAKSGPVISSSQGSAFAPIGFTASASASATTENQTFPKTTLSTMPFAFGSAATNAIKSAPSVSQVKPSFSTPSFGSTASLKTTTSEATGGFSGNATSIFKSSSDSTTVKTQSSVTTPNFAFSFGSGTPSTKPAFGLGSNATTSVAGSSNILFASTPTSSTIFPTPSSSSAITNTQINKPINIASSAGSSAVIKPLQTPSTSSIFGSQQSSFAPLTKSVTVTTVTTTVSLSSQPKATSGVATIFANIQSVIDKATSSGAATSSGDTTSTKEDAPKPTLSVGISSAGVTTTTQSLFGPVSSISATKPVFGTTTASTTGLFGSIAKATESSTLTSSTPNLFGNSVNFSSSSGTSSLVENLKLAENTNDSSLTTSTSSSAVKNIESTIATTQISKLETKPASPVSSAGISLAGLATTTSNTPSIFSSGSVTSVSKPGTSIFGTSTTSSTVVSGTESTIFGVSKTNTSTTSSVFATTTQTSSIFGNAPPGTTSMSGSSTAASNIFGASNPPASASNKFSNSGSVFGKSETISTTTSGANIFGTPTTTTTTSIFAIQESSKNIFGTQTSTGGFIPSTTSTNAVTTPTPAAGGFGTPTTSSNIFSSSGSIFGGTPVSSTSNIFGSPTATNTNVFGTPSTTTTNVFGTPSTTNTNVFGTPSTTTTNVFGTPTTAPSTSIFGGAAPASNAPSVFGSTSNAPTQFGSQSSSIFGTPKTTGSVFGQQSNFGSSGAFQTTQATTASSIFGQPASFGSGTSDFGSSTTTTSGNIFGSAASSSSNFGSGFGATSTTNTFGSQATTQAQSTNAFGLGSLSVGGTSSSGSIFGGSTGSAFGASQGANPFGKVEAKSPFESSGTNIFGNSASGSASTNIFASPATTASSIFGSSSGTAFGASTPGTGFGSPNSFGASAFGQKPTFGQSSGFGSSTFGSPQPGSFSSGGASPIAQTGFGSPATFQKPSGFGSPPVFGGAAAPAFGSSPSFGGAPAFGSAPTFGSPEKVFGTSQPATGGFGAAAAQQAAPFGNLASQNTIGFGSLAQQANTQTSTPFQGGSTSFSSWR